MKSLLTILLFYIIPVIGFSQELDYIAELTKTLKSESIIDSTDKQIYSLMDDFFNENLQTNNPTLSENTIKKFQSLLMNEKTKNHHLLGLFAIYQKHISESIETGKTIPNLQVKLMETLANEYKAIYNSVPVLIYIYLIEAYNASKQIDQAAFVLEESRQLYPDAIPLKVYQYMSTKDENLKEDIVQNHADHWLVKRFNIN